MGLSIISRDLPRDICGLYDDRHGLILLADWLNQRQRRCTLCHELIHARHHDPGCGSQYGIKCERRCRRETALALISPVDYGMAETVYEGNTWMMAVELGVTIQVLNDYRQLLYIPACACSSLYAFIRAYRALYPFGFLIKKTPATRIPRASGSCCYLFFLISWIICGPAVTAPMSAGCVNTLSCCGKAVAVRHWPSRRSGRAASSVSASRRSLQCVYTLVVWMSVWPMMAVRSSSLAPAAASSVASQCRAL